MNTLWSERAEHSVNSFMSTESSRLDRSFTDLLKANRSTGNSEHGFFFGGKLYSPHTARQLRGIEIKPLPESLFDQAFTFLRDKERFDRNIHVMRMNAKVIGMRCSSAQEFRDMFPEPLAVKTEQTSNLTRSRGEGYFLAHFPQLRSQFERLSELTYYYQANHLIF